MLGALCEKAVRLLRRSTVEYIYVSDIVKHYPLGLHTRDSAVVAGVNLYIRLRFTPGIDFFKHAFGVHHSACERVDTMQGNSVQCDADRPDGYCWEGVVEIER